MSLIKRVAKVIPPQLVPNRLRVVGQLLHGTLYDYGWLRSYKEGRAVDPSGKALPWFTYPAIDFLRQFDYSDKTVFEWGAGQSTLFWSARAKRVVSVEHDAKWLSYLSRHVTPNCELIYSDIENASYINKIEAYPDGFDVIVIDGSDFGRLPGSMLAPKYLREGGFVILDNSDQCPESARALRMAGLIQIDFTGFAPGCGYAQTTSLFLDRKFRFAPLGDIQPRPSPAQPNAPWPDA